MSTDDSVLEIHGFLAVGGEFPNTCQLCGCFRHSANHATDEDYNPLDPTSFTRGALISGRRAYEAERERCIKIVSEMQFATPRVGETYYSAFARVRTAAIAKIRESK